jgi:hypothetical protein
LHLPAGTKGSDFLFFLLLIIIGVNHDEAILLVGKPRARPSSLLYGMY